MYRLIVSSQNSYVEILTLKVTMLGGGVFGRLDRLGGTLMK